MSLQVKGIYYRGIYIGKVEGEKDLVIGVDETGRRIIEYRGNYNMPTKIEDYERIVDNILDEAENKWL